MEYSQPIRTYDVTGGSHSLSVVASGQGDCVQLANSVRHLDTVAANGRNWKIGTCNVRTLFQAGKLANVAQEMERSKVDVLGLSEVRWTGCGEVNYQD